MLLRTFKNLFFIFFIVSIILIGDVWAQEYTTNSGNTAKKSLPEPEPMQCTLKDVRSIKRFDNKAKRHISQLKKFAQEEQGRTKAEKEKMSYAKTARNAKRFKQIRAFFYSEEYEQMKIIYERCGKKIPSLRQVIPTAFWAPDGMYGTEETCSRCSQLQN